MRNPEAHHYTGGTGGTGETGGTGAKTLLEMTPIRSDINLAGILKTNRSTQGC